MVKNFDCTHHYYRSGVMNWLRWLKTMLRDVYLGLIVREKAKAAPSHLLVKTFTALHWLQITRIILETGQDSPLPSMQKLHYVLWVMSAVNTLRYVMPISFNFSNSSLTSSHRYVQLYSIKLMMLYVVTMPVMLPVYLLFS